MRPVVAVIAGLVAFAAAVVTVPLLWVSTHVADEDGYVRFSSELATDQKLQEAFVARLVDEYVQRKDIPESLQEPVTSALIAVTRTTTNQPGFVEAWEQTQRDLHRSAFKDGDGPLTVSLRPMATFVTSRLDRNLPISLEVPGEVRAQIGTAQDRERLVWVERSQTWSLLGLLVVLVAATVSLVAARSRPLALAGLGLGALATAGVLRVAIEIAVPEVTERAESKSPFARAVQPLLVDRAAASLTDWLVWIALGGGAAVVLGVLGRLMSGRPRRG
ncbi:hypothetical protein [Aeromicrobium wangtongii]|uniref:hypothetical protein n=1 Tax=Aeromicrobium wangtongii TaxID=2969247 RepID=UPI00201795A2|nr:hypothetical protein [Aeromicrobium wangtongii]MCL3817369.1 hypothetical protein [Aeromicrobium wangtongii]